MANTVAKADGFASASGQAASLHTRAEAVRRESRLYGVGSTVLAGVLAKVVTVICNLALVPTLVGYLGPGPFGIWAAYQSIQSILLFADFGIGNGMQNAVTAAIAHGDTRRARALVSSAFAALAAAAGLIGVLAIVAVVWSPLPSWFAGTRLDAAEQAASQVGIAVFVATGLLAIPLSCGERLAVALQRGFITHVTRTIATVASLACVLVLVRQRAGFAAICLATATPILVGPLLSWFFVARRSGWAWPAMAAVRASDIKAVLSSGAGFLAVQLTAIFGFGLDPLLIERYAGPVEVANYAVVQRLFSVVPMAIGIVLAPLWPAYADARARSDSPWICTTFRRSLLATAAVAAGLSMAIAVLAEPITWRWLGKALEPSAALIYAFATWSCVLSCGMAFSYFWNGMHMLRLQAVLGLIFVLVSLPAKIICLHGGDATVVAAINSVAFVMSSLLPGAFATWMTLRALGAFRTRDQTNPSAHEPS